METIDVDFDSSDTQAFGIGEASAAVPGMVAGLETAHRTYGRVRWAELFEPAIALARNGVVLTPEQGYLHAILDTILRHTESGRAIYGPDGERLAAGDLLKIGELASTLQLLADEGAAPFYEGDLADRLATHVRAEGGPLRMRTSADTRWSGGGRSTRGFSETASSRTHLRPREVS